MRLIQQQLPYLTVEVELEQPEYLGVDQQQHQRQGSDDGRDEPQRLLLGQHEAEREDRQQVGDKTQKREVANPAYNEVDHAKRGRWPADGTQITGGDEHGQNNVEEGEPMPPGDQARDIITIGVTGFDHSDPSALRNVKSTESQDSVCVVAIIDRCGQGLDKLFSDGLALGRCHTVDDIGGQIAKHHKAEIHRRFMLFQRGDQVVHQGVKLLVIVL